MPNNINVQNLRPEDRRVTMKDLEMVIARTKKEILAETKAYIDEKLGLVEKTADET